jgi:broad specificity phosphatase PhoE
MLLSLIKLLFVFSYFHSGGDQHTTGFMSLLLAGARRIIASSSSSVVATRKRTTMTATVTATESSSSKIVYIVRHGESQHNPRAEAAKSNGCSMEEFFDLMRQDDAWDADLTDLGRRQAKKCRDDHFSVRDDNNNIVSNNNNPLGVDLVIGSSLSRTMDTADVVFPPDEQIPRISLEYFREVNGHFLNGKRRNKKELNSKFPHWNFDSLTTEEDESWTPDIEKYEDVAERGYLGLVALLTGRYNNNDDDDDDDDNESKSKITSSNENYNNILLACHGGILRYVMTIHPLVHLSDERTKNTSSDNNKSVESRFDNCEFRKYRLSWKEDSDLDSDGNVDDDAEKKTEDDRQGTTRRAIVLTQLDH